MAGFAILVTAVAIYSSGHDVSADGRTGWLKPHAKCRCSFDGTITGWVECS